MFKKRITKLVAAGTIAAASLGITASPADAAHCTPIYGNVVVYSFAGYKVVHRAVGYTRSGRIVRGNWVVGPAVSRAYTSLKDPFVRNTCQA